MPPNRLNRDSNEPPFVELPNPLRQAAKRLLELGLPKSALLVRGPRGAQSACLTFDDGPHPVHTARLLDALRAHRVPATFFVVGERAAAHPHLVRRMASEGHVVGHHSFHHKSPDETGWRELLDEVRRTVALLERLLGATPRLFRPPHGKLTAAKLGSLWLSGQSTILWSRDPRDYARASAADVLLALAADPVGPGDIVLLHDTCPHGPAVVAELARSLRAQGIALGTVDGWL